MDLQGKDSGITETYPKIFSFVRSRSGPFSAFNRGVLMNSGLIFAILVFSIIVYIFIKTEFNTRIGAVLFFFSIAVLYIVNTHLNIVQEVRIDGNFLCIRKFLKLREVLWADIACIKSTTYRTSGFIRAKIIKKEEAEKLQCRSFYIFASPLDPRKIDLRNQLFDEIEKKAKLIKRG